LTLIAEAVRDTVGRLVSAVEHAAALKAQSGERAVADVVSELCAKVERRAHLNTALALIDGAQVSVRALLALLGTRVAAYGDDRDDRDDRDGEAGRHDAAAAAAADAAVDSAAADANDAAADADADGVDNGDNTGGDGDNGAGGWASRLMGTLDACAAGLGIRLPYG
jgi:hypothetical protein